MLSCVIFSRHFSIDTLIFASFIFPHLPLQYDRADANISTLDKHYEKALSYLNTTFTIIFTVECILKLFAYGIKVGIDLFCLQVKGFKYWFGYVTENA